jgi:hypothetical protein
MDGEHSDLTDACRTSLLEVSVSRPEQRLKRKGKKEIEMT